MTLTTVTDAARGAVGRGILQCLFMFFGFPFRMHFIWFLLLFLCAGITVFFSVFFANVFQCILFDFCPISVRCCYYCGEKRLVNSIPFFMAMIIMMVIVDGERSSTSLLFWVCEADWQSLMAMDIVVIVTEIAVVYSFSTIIMGGWLQSLSMPLLGEGEGGGVYSTPPTAVVGEMTPTAVAATARRVAGWC